MGNISQKCCKYKQQLDPPSPPPQYLTVQNFISLNFLGQGKFGQVLKVKKMDNDNIYAMKLISKKKLIQFGLTNNTLIQKQILAFNHPFLVKLSYSFQNNKFLYLVMEYMDGGDLFYILKRQNRFPQQLVKIIVAQVYQALCYLHSRNIMYRDLKPENILFDKSGHIKITDFGLSKVQRSGQLAYTLAGTADYISPQVLNNKGYNHLIDLWGLGVLVYQLTHGYPPFSSVDNAVRQNILKCNYHIGVPVSEQCSDFIRRLLQIEPTHRLGAVSMDQIRDHQWFKDLNWHDLINKEIKGPLTQLYKKYESIRDVKYQSGRQMIQAQSLSYNVQNFTYIKQQDQQ